MDLLSELATKHGTDKGPKHHNYTPIYDKIMGPTRLDVKAVLEIGLQYGASARMWLDYFPNASIFSVDNDMSSIISMEKSDTSHRWLGIARDQTDPEVWFGIAENSLDYVIDDGSHRPEDMVATLENGFKYVKPGGLYIIEDGHCAFHENFNTHLPDNIIYNWISKRIIDQQRLGIMSGNFYLEREKDRYPEHDNLYGMIYSFQFYKSLIILERAND